MKIPVHFSENNEQFQVKFLDGIGVKKYDGEYTVVPTPKGSTLPTKNKKMVEDLMVDPIPFYETSNPQGGNTIYIGYLNQE